jgi:hypothetical protein
LIVVILFTTPCNAFREPPPPPTTIEEIKNLDEVEFYSDGTKLVGRLVVPEGEGPYPAIVLVHSSGRGTRHDFDPLMVLLQASGLTANVMAGDREMTFEAGMDDYVAKPIRVEELIGALSRVTPLHEKGEI